MTITASGGPYAETFVIQQYFKAEGNNYALVYLTINLYVSEQINAATVSSITDGLSFVINGSTRTAFMSSGSGSFLYSGSNEIVANITDGCQPKITLQDFTSNELSNTSGFITSTNNPSKLEYIISSTHQNPNGTRLIYFNNGTWFKLKYSKIPSILIIENLENKHLEFGYDTTSIVLDWNGYSCYDTLIIRHEFDTTILNDTLKGSLNTTGSNTYYGLIEGRYQIEAHNGTDWEDIYYFEILPPVPDPIECGEVTFSAAYSCSETKSTLDISANVPITVDVSEMVSSLSSPFPFGIPMEDAGGDFKIPTEFSFLDGMGKENISVSLSVTDSYGTTCNYLKNAPYEKAKVTGSILTRWDCTYSEMYELNNNTTLVTNNACDVTSFTANGLDLNDSQAAQSLTTSFQFGGSPVFKDNNGEELNSTVQVFEEIDPEPYIYSTNYPYSIMEGDAFPVLVDAQASEIIVNVGSQNKVNTSWGSSQVNFDFLNLEPGNYPIEIEANNYMFNCFYPVGESSNVEVINVEPKFTSVSPGPLTPVSHGDVITLTVNAYDPGGVTSMTGTYNGQAITLTGSRGDYSGTITIDDQATSQEITFSAYDDFGGSGDTSVIFNIIGTVDPISILSTNPSSSITLNAGDDISVDFMVNLPLNIDQSEISYNGQTVSGLTANFILEGQGTQSILFYVKDTEGNEDQVSIDLTVNNLPPFIDLLSPTNSENFVISSTIPLSYVLDSIDDAIASAELTFNGLTYDLLSNVSSLPAPTIPGFYSLDIVVQDITGLESTVSVNITIIDHSLLINDVVFIGLTENEDYTTGTSATIDFTIDGSYNANSIIVLYDGTPVSVTGFPHSFNLDFVGKGNQTVEIQVEDVNGKIYTKNITFNVINTPPIAVIIEPVDFQNVIFEDLINLNIVFDDAENNLATATVEFEGTIYDWLSNPQTTFNPSSLGVKSIIIQGIDDLGESFYQEITINVNARIYQLPLVTIVSPMINSMTSDTNDLLIDIEVLDIDNLGIEKIEIIFEKIDDSENLIYKKELLSGPFVLSFDDLDYFPWTEGTIGMQVLLNTSDGRTVSKYTEFYIDIENNYAIGLADLEDEIELKIYPNPCYGKLGIHLNTEASYTLRDLHGHIIQKGSIDQFRSLDLLPFSEGLYLLELQIGESILIKKISLL